MKNTIEDVYKASLKFLDPLTPENTYATIVHEAVKLVKGEDGLIVLKKSSGLEVVYGSSPAIRSVRIRKRGYTYQSYKEKRAFIIVPKDFVQTHPAVAEYGIKSSIFLPLSYKNKSIGVLLVRSFDNLEFTQREVEILKLFGSMASLAIRKTELYSETKYALEVRDTFLSMASHELRTPLTVINGYAQMLYKKFKNSHSVEAEWIKKLYIENIRLTNLVKELLEVNKIRSGQVQYFWVEFSVGEITSSILKQFKERFSQRHLIFMNEITDKNIKLVGDKEKIVQMTMSIFDNAVKFSSQNTDIKFTISQKKSYIVMCIEDMGEGISKDNLSRIFESFYKGEMTKEGIGIGLYLVRSIINEHRGTIKIASKKNKGTKVMIRLPILKL